MDPTISRMGLLGGRPSRNGLPRFVLASLLLVALGACGAAHHDRSARSYPLPSDGWKAGEPEAGVILTGNFEASLTKQGACAWLGPAKYVTVWPAGYRVRFNPTELIAPDGRVVAKAGEYVGFNGGHVTREMALPSFCGDPSTGALMLQGPSS